MSNLAEDEGLADDQIEYILKKLNEGSSETTEIFDRLGHSRYGLAHWNTKLATDQGILLVFLAISKLSERIQDLEESVENLEGRISELEDKE